MSEVTKQAIAIVGCGCKVPGADNLEEFWRLLERGENHVIEIPKDRWNHDAFYDADRHAAGKTYAKKAGLLKDPLAFDNKLFNIPNVEADQMDPQQRYVLECVYRAMEDGGHHQGRGAMNADYSGKFDVDSSVSSNYTVTGVSNSLIAARVSYVFDFRGPSMTIDTACSSALVAVHLGVQALKIGDCDIAICGGTNFTWSPDIFIHLAKANMASEAGQCFTFSDRADGYTRGEGCAMVILKRLPEVTTKDKVWATIETGCNQDGGTVSPVSAPSKDQQYELLQEIYAQTRTDPNSIQYIEAHGTGTPIGDPTEVNALGQFFTAQNFAKLRHIGSVKTNIGHLESAAGTAGLIKVLLMMKHSKIVPSLFFDKPNPKIDFKVLKFIVPTKVEDWSDEKKGACINSFGFGGTNCHAIIHACDKQVALQNSPNKSMASPYIVCFSGQSPESLTGSMNDFTSYPNVETFNLHDVSYTSTVRREHHKCRQAFVVKTMEELLTRLNEHLKVPSLTLPSPVQQPRHIVFVFCGMGSDWVGMGVEMMKSSSVFRNAVQQIDQILKEFVDWSLENRLSAENHLKDLNFWPIAIFACQIGLAKLWDSISVVPDCVVGHSVGEVAAAHVAGILSLKDAVKVIYSRTKVLADLGSNGGMIVVRNMAVGETKMIMHDFEGKAEVSAEISPVCCAVSADSECISKLRETLLKKAQSQNQKVDVIDLPVFVGYHSHCVEPCKEKLAQMLQDVSPTKPKIDMISTVTGEYVQLLQDDVLDKAYWVRNMRDSVKFLDAVQKSLKKDCDNIFIEVGPKPFMGPHVRDIFSESNMKTIPSMVRDSGIETFINAASHVYEHGCNVKWQNIPGAYDGQKVTPVPRYCFQQRRKLDLSERAYMALHGINFWKSHHPFVFKARKDNEYKLILSEMTFPSVYDHRVSSELIVPGALYGEVGFAIAKEMFPTKARHCSVSVTLTKPCRLEIGKPVFLDVVVKKSNSNDESNSKYDLAVMRENMTYASIELQTLDRMKQKYFISLSEIQARCPTQIEKSKIYEMLGNLGFDYGPHYAILGDAQRSDQECLTQMFVPSSMLSEMSRTTLHPSIIDAMMQTGSIISQGGTKRHVLPVSIGQLRSFDEPRDEMFVYTQHTRDVGNLSIFRIQLVSMRGKVIAEIEDVVIKTLAERDTDDYAKSGWVPTVMNYKDKLEMKLVNNHCVRYGTNGTATANIKAQIKDLADKSSGQDFLVIHGDIFIDDSEDGVSIQSKVLNTCKLLKEIFTHGFEKRIYLFTKWGISISDTPSNIENINPIMTALWGLTRCALMEMVADIVIVDLHLPEETCSPEFLTSLANVIHKNDSLVYFRQWVATEDNLLTHQVLPWQLKDEIVPNFKEVFADTSKNMVMVSTESNSFNLYQKDPSFKRQPSKTVTIDVTETGLPNHDIFSMSLTQDDEPQRIDSQQGKAEFALERVGNVDGQTNSEIISCYPSVTCTKITVPIEATVKRSLFDNYSLGYLSKLVVLYSLCQSVNKDSVTIIVSPSTLGLGNILQLMFEAVPPSTTGFGDILRRMCKVSPEDKNVSVVLADQLQNECALKKSIISLVRLEKKTVLHLGKNWSDARMFVTLTPLLQEKARAQFTLLFPEVEIVEHTGASLFQGKNIGDVVPKICKWMTDNGSLKATISKLLKTSDTVPLYHNSPNDLGDLLQMTKVQFDTSKVCVPQNQMFDKHAVYIVVGGLTGLGWMFVEFLAKNGAGNIAIMNRRKANDTDEAAMGALSKKGGCIIESFQADVIKPKVLKRSMALIKETFKNKPLRGVFFGAAVLKDQLLSQIDWKDFEYVLSSKVMGSWNMHQLTKEQDLDFFVLQSSVTAVFGNSGQSSYAAGNAFMDGLAPYRRHRSLAGQSINWGPLDTGLLESTREGAKKIIEILESSGILLLQKEEIAASMCPTLLLNRAQTMQCKMDFNIRGVTSQNANPNSHSDEIIIDQDLNLQLQRAQSLSEQERVDLYERFFISLISQILGDRAHGIQSHSNLRDFGMDSLIAVRVHGEVKRRLACDLHLMVLLSDPVPRVIAEKINEIKHGKNKN